MWFDTKCVVLTDGVAIGKTNINAFDNALRAARVADFNLLKVTSIVPPATEVRQLDRLGQPISGLGRMLPTVYEVLHTKEPGELISVGVGIGVPLVVT